MVIAAVTAAPRASRARRRPADVNARTVAVPRSPLPLGTQPSRPAKRKPRETFSRQKPCAMGGGESETFHSRRRFTPCARNAPWVPNLPVSHGGAMARCPHPWRFRAISPRRGPAGAAPAIVCPPVAAWQSGCAGQYVKVPAEPDNRHTGLTGGPPAVLVTPHDPPVLLADRAQMHQVVERGLVDGEPAVPPRRLASRITPGTWGIRRYPG